MTTMTEAWADCETLAAKFIQFLETNTAPDGLFADDLFLDFTSPMWRQQSDTREGAVAIRRAGHHHRAHGAVPRHRLDLIERGFVLEVEEVWTEDDGEQMYCRELFRADVGKDGVIHKLSVYCTGDWTTAQVARHKQLVTLIRP